MLKKLKIINYKLFKDIEFDDFSRINIFTGDNNSGKSTVLEAIDIAFGYYVRDKDKIFRGLVNNVIVNIENELPKIFNNHNSDSVEFKMLFDGNNFETKLVKGVNVTDFTVSNSMKNAVFAPHARYSVTSKNSSYFSDIMVDQNSGNIVFQPLKMELPVVYHFDCTRTYTHIILGDILKVASNKEVILEFLQLFDSRILDIALLDREIWLNIGEKDLIPVRYMGQGINNLMGLVCHLLLAKNSILLIDEIETGIYYKRFATMIKTLDEYATRFNVQLFITTHSKDFMNNLDAFVGDYAVYKLNRKFKLGYVKNSKSETKELLADGLTDIR